VRRTAAGRATELALAAGGDWHADAAPVVTAPEGLPAHAAARRLPVHPG